MNARLLHRFVRYEAYAAARCLQMLGERASERRWARDVDYIEGPTTTPCAVIPCSHSEGWPFVRVTPETQHPLERILAKLEAAKPSAAILSMTGTRR